MQPYAHQDWSEFKVVKKKKAGNIYIYTYNEITIMLYSEERQNSWRCHEERRRCGSCPKAYNTNNIMMN